MKLNSILKTFDKTLNQLDRYIEQADKEIEQNEQALTAIQEENYACHQNMQKAIHTRGQVAKLIDPNE